MSSDTKNTPTDKRLPYVDMLRIFAAFVVCVSHLCDIERKYDPSPILPDRLNWGVFGVDMFFVISGYLMVVIAKRYGEALRPGAYLLDRAARIYPLYWVVSAALLVVWIIRPDMVFASNAAPSIWKSFVLWPHTSEPLHALGYSLIHFMFFYMMFAGLALIFKARRIITGLAIWGAVLGTVIIAQHLMDAVPTRQTPELRMITHPYALSFILGGLIAGIPKSRSLGKVAMLVGALATLFSMLGPQYLFDYHMKMDTLGRIAYRSVPFAVLVYGAGCFSTAPFRLPFQQQLADMAFSIFLIHVLSFTLVGRLWAPFATDALWDNVLMIIVMFAFTLVVSWLAYILIERPACRAIRGLTRPRPAADRVL